MSAWTHFPLETGCQDYSFLDQVFEDFEHGLDSILIDFVNIPELDASFHEDDAMTSSIFLGLLLLVSTHSDNSSLWLAPDIKSQITVPSEGTTFTCTTGM